jgi:Protein of unknown function (DUF4232)
MRDKIRRRMRTAIVAGVIAGGSIAAVAPAMAATRSTTPTCDLTDVTVSLGHVDSGAGQRYATLDFATTGRTCVLRNDLTDFTFFTSGPEGGAQSVPADVVREAGSTDESVVLSPGSEGSLDLHWSAVNDPFAPTSLRFALPSDGGDVALPWGESIDQSGQLGIGHLHPAGA